MTAAILAVTMSVLRIHQNKKTNTVANILNHVALGFVTGALFCDVVKMNFGLDPAIAINPTQTQSLTTKT